MKSEKDFDAGNNQDLTQLIEQARAARGKYIGRLLENAFGAIARGIRSVATAGVILVRRKSEEYDTRRFHQTYPDG